MPKTRIKPVIQEEATGCAIAAAAALAGLPYSKAAQIAASLGITARDRSLWSQTAPIRRLLLELGISIADRQTPFTSWNALPHRALLAIKWHMSQGTPYWHWVVFVRDGATLYVLDSKKGLKNNVRQDFGRMKPKWFLKVASN